MKRWCKLIAGPQSVGLVRDSLWGASAKTNNQSFENILGNKEFVTEIVFNNDVTSKSLYSPIV